MTETIGKQSDEAAFQAVLAAYCLDTYGKGPIRAYITPSEEDELLHFFFAGKAHGLELRGCCEEPQP